MRKFASFLILTAWVGGCGHCGHCDAADPVAASVRVDCSQGGGVTYSGSGTVVAVEDGRALVLTNRHVAEHDGPISVKHTDGKTYGAVWLGTDATADLAALMIAAPPGDPCPPAAAALTSKVTVTQVGYPHAVGPVRRVGEWLGCRGSWRGGAWIVEATIQTQNGDSGSGVFHNGELAAIVWGGDGRNCSCVELRDIHRFCGSGPVAQRFPQLAKRLSCPAGVPACECGCADGKPCACGTLAKADAKPKLIDAKACPAGVKDCQCPCSTGGACAGDKAAVLSKDGKYRLAGWYSSAGVWQYDFWVPVAEYRVGKPTTYASSFGCGSCSGGSCRGR